MSDRYMARGDTLPSLEVILEADGYPVNLAGCTVTVTIQPLEGGADIVTDGTCIVAADQDADTGNVVYEWRAGDTATLGFYLAQWTVIDAANEVWHFPNDGRYTIQIVEILEDQ